MPLTLSPAITHTRRLRSANSSLGWSAGERDRFEITESFLECKNAVTALDSGFGKRLSSTEVEGTLKDWPTDEQASLGRADGSFEPLPSSYNSLSLVADASSPSSLQLPIPRMQVREFEMTMATRWWDADDDEDTALPRIPWQTAAGSANPGCMAAYPHLRTSLMFVRVPFQSCSANAVRSPSWCCRRPRVCRRAGAGLSLRRGSDPP